MANLFIYEQIKDYLTNLIVENRDNNNYKLPSEQQVAQKFGASRVSVRKAFALLEEEGTIYRIKGKGTFIQPGQKTQLLTARENPMNCYVFIVPNVASRLVENICKGMLTASLELGCKLLVLNSLISPQIEKENISTAIRLNCAGILLMPVDDNNYNDSILSLSLSGFPTLFIDRRLYGLNINCISSDHYFIGYNAASYLLKRNHENILVLSMSRNISSVRQRLDGYEAALNEYRKGLYKRYILNVEDYIPEPPILFEVIYNYLKDNPQITACISSSNLPATGLVKALQRLGRNIGKDFDIVLYDEDSQVISDLIDYRIPTVVQDGYNIGRTALKMLYKYTNENVPMTDKIIPLEKTV